MKSTWIVIWAFVATAGLAVFMYLYFDKKPVNNDGLYNDLQGKIDVLQKERDSLVKVIAEPEPVTDSADVIANLNNTINELRKRKVPVRTDTMGIAGYQQYFDGLSRD